MSSPATDAENRHQMALREQARQENRDEFHELIQAWQCGLIEQDQAQLRLRAIRPDWFGGEA